MSAQKILIIDDEVDLTKLTAKRIRAAGYEVDCYFEGNNALQAIRQSRPDLVLLDLKLPDVSGTEIFTNLRKQDDLKSIPVIFLTAMHREEHYCLNVLGADGFITKPYEPALLLGAIKQALAATSATAP